MDRESLDRITRIIITLAIKVHSRLGPGLLESVYRTCLIYELRKAGLQVAAEKTVPLFYDGLYLGDGYRLDLLVNNAVIVEVKAVEAVLPVHVAQLLSYLRLTDKRVGLLLNFNAPRLVQGLRRVVNRL
jgi:GxxExxY protein